MLFKFTERPVLVQYSSTNQRQLTFVMNKTKWREFIGYGNTSNLKQTNYCTRIFSLIGRYVEK